MTLVFGAGIFTFMMPAVLGVAAISKFLFVNHDAIYYTGGIVMILAAVITFLGLKLPMPNLPGANQQKADILSVFMMGIFSGITSACCAPVLIGILALTFLSPNFFGALAIGAMYVLGMVMPLLFIAVFLHGKITKFMFLRKPVISFMFFGKKRVIIVSNLIAGVIFLLTGMMIIYLKATGRLGMEDTEGFSKLIQEASNIVNQSFGGNVFINILFLITLIFLFYKISKKL